MTRISIAMATFNGARYIVDQLVSIAAQSRIPDELIVSDDGSSDETMALVESFADKAPFAVQIHRNASRLGFNRNFERALSMCSGQLIFISDQDDVWDSGKIERVVTAFQNHPEMLALVHDERIAAADNTILNQSFFGNARKLAYPDRELLSGNCTAIRRELLSILEPFPEGVNYDYWIGWFADVLEARIVLEEVLQLYRRHETNASTPILADSSPSHLAIFLASGFSNSHAEWTDTVRILTAIKQRIVERETQIDGILGSGRSRGALKKIDSEIRRVTRRVSLASVPRVRRSLSIIRLWSTGFYDDFSGYKSALKDLIRPRKKL